MGLRVFRRKSTKWQRATLTMGLFAFCMLGSRSPSYQAALPSQRELPFVQISAISVEPKEIGLSEKHKEPAAVVTVSIFHLSLAAPQTVRFNVGTYSTMPQTGITASYDPPSQSVTVPAGPGGTVVVKARIGHFDIGRNPQAELTIAATLSSPSSGIRIEHPLAPENYRVTLTVRNRKQN